MESENTREQVSCGHQLITFSDPQHRVDTGHLHRLALQVRLGHNNTCHTVIRLNGTHTMRGEQETTWVPHLPLYIYLGGAPRDMLTFTDTDWGLVVRSVRLGQERNVIRTSLANILSQLDQDGEDNNQLCLVDLINQLIRSEDLLKSS